MPGSLALSGSGKAHVVVHIPETPEVMVISSNDELIEELEGDPEEDPKFEEYKIDHNVEGD